MGMSAFYGGQEEEESLKVLTNAADLGSTFWDTSVCFIFCAIGVCLLKVQGYLRTTHQRETHRKMVQGDRSPQRDFLGDQVRFDASVGCAR